jgi:hypothetical protein
VLRDQSRYISPEPKERGMAERHDAGIAEDQVERDREESDDRDFVEDEMAVGEEE